MGLDLQPDIESIVADFDEIARLVDAGGSGTDRYDPFLLSLIPARAVDVLEIGCGLGRLTTAIAAANRDVVGVDVSPVMIERARLARGSQPIEFVCGDFLAIDFGGRTFDCIVSAATFHHMPAERALGRMAAMLRPAGRLILQDLRRDATVADALRAYTALAAVALRRFVQTGRARPPRRVREAWARHYARETYRSLDEARQLAERLLPGARVFSHWLWRYTIVWDKPLVQDAVVESVCDPNP